LSKSLRGRHAIMDPRAGKAKAFDLKLYPMVMQELQHVPAEQRVGPIVKDEATGLPWRTFKFRQRWRAIARAAGVPDEVQNRDSRAGGITEGIEATGGDIEAARKAAGHAQASTTARYSRGDDRATAKVAVLRAERRKRERPE
jgi:integrase